MASVFEESVVEERCEMTWSATDKNIGRKNIEVSARFDCATFINAFESYRPARLRW